MGKRRAPPDKKRLKDEDNDTQTIGNRTYDGDHAPHDIYGRVRGE